VEVKLWAKCGYMIIKFIKKFVNFMRIMSTVYGKQRETQIGNNMTHSYVLFMRCLQSLGMQSKWTESKKEEVISWGGL